MGALPVCFLSCLGLHGALRETGAFGLHALQDSRIVGTTSEALVLGQSGQ
jgi:hypothetical protein